MATLLRNRLWSLWPLLPVLGIMIRPQAGPEPPFFPGTVDARPTVASPRRTPAGEELIVVRLQDRGWCQVEVTVVNGRPFSVLDRVRGRGPQLEVDAADFPTLAATGLHAEQELAGVRTITGRPLAEINRIARPGQLSGAGFIAREEDLITVLREDNRLVARLGLTHPELAAPLFHIWNLSLRRADHADSTREWLEFASVLYNGGSVQIDVQGTRGFQESIFDDGIQGSHNLNIWRDPTPTEIAWLEARYGRLGRDGINRMIVRLGRIEIGEMVPFYITRYGFYEGHTAYRADPLAIAFIFGLRSLSELDAACDGDLYRALTTTYPPPAPPIR